MGGSWAANYHSFKPQLTTQGTDDYADFNTSQDRIDDILGVSPYVNGSTTIAGAIAAIGSTTATLRIPTGNWSITADLTIPSNVKLKFEYGAILVIATTKTLTINGKIDAGIQQVFSCTGTGKVVFGTAAVPDVVLAVWFGADPSGLIDSTDAIQDTINSLPTTIGGVVQLGIGTYYVTPNQLEITTAGTVLQGRAAATDGLGAWYGTTIKSAAGTGELISFLGAAAATPIDSCQINNLSIRGEDKTVIGLSLKWVSNFRSRNVVVSDCLDDGVYIEQAWDSSFYDLEIEACGAQGTGKVGLHIYNGATDNCNNLRFFAFHAEGNYGDDVWVDSTAAGTGGNYNILFQGGKCEKSQEVGTYSTKAFKISGYDGVDGRPNQNITIRDMGIMEYMVAGDIGVHFAGSGYVMVDNCFFANNVDGGSGIKIEGPVDGPHVHRLTGNRFQYVETEITIDTSTCPRNQVWTDGNVNTLYTETDSRIAINSDLVQDRRPMVLETWAGTEQTSGTGEDILASTTVLAGQLSTFGGLKIHAGGASSGVADNKTIKFKFGSEVVTVYGPDALPEVDWLLEVTIRNAAVAEQWLDWKMTVMDSPIAITAGVVYPTQDTSADVVVTITGECADGGDILYLGAWRVAEE